MDLKIPIIGIVRGIPALFFKELMTTSFSLGLQAIEITMNTADAEEIVSTCRPLVPQGHLLGMGTICNVQEAKRAIDAGAMFLVTPNLNIEIIKLAQDHDIPVVAGALTPTEVYTAWHAGADLIKIFPCRSMGGARYIRDLLGPFNGAPLVPVGGVDAESLKDYFAAGATAVGVGPALFGKQALAQQDIQAVQFNIKNFINNCPTPPGSP